MGLMKSIAKWLMVHGESGNTKAIDLSKYTDRVGEAGLSEILVDAKKLKLETVEELQRVTDLIISDDDPKLVERAKLLRQRIDDVKWDIEHIVSAINRYSYMRSILPETEADYRRAVASYDANVANNVGNNACDRLSNVLRVKKDVQVLSDRVTNRMVIMGKLETMKSITILKRSITAEGRYVLPYREEHSFRHSKRDLNDMECVCAIVNNSTLCALSQYDSISKSRDNQFRNQDELESYAASGKNRRSLL